MPDQYITATEARKRLGMTEYMLAKMLREGRLPWTPDPFNKNAKLIKVADVEELEKQRLRAPTHKRRQQPEEQKEMPPAA